MAPQCVHPSSNLSPEKAYLSLIKSGTPTTPTVLMDIYDQLRPIVPAFLLGEWAGGDFDTGHPVTRALKRINWAGKTFRSTEDVDPIVVHGEGGARIVLETYGNARIREVKFRGVVSAAMIYDNKPIIDHFRYVDEDTVAGMMDLKDGPPGYHFYLTRYRGTTSTQRSRL
ncbi:hypothetical protein GGX14DRAFT_444269 [Mycena pura]|uniref:Uncharacterized protein n=1 Tax=Mycena pura TaxID=153505 RepID=A0AAD6VLV9_9AGAR|nr:hypothetical protein GGX14DRAFT_444269 [Mycena pura]